MSKITGKIMVDFDAINKTLEDGYKVVVEGLIIGTDKNIIGINKEHEGRHGIFIEEVKK